MSKKIMMTFLTLLCICTFSAKNLFAEIQITLDEEGEPATYHDDGVGNWYFDAMGGLSISSRTRSYVRLDAMYAASTHWMIGPSFCFNEVVSENWDGTRSYYMTRNYYNGTTNVSFNSSGTYGLDSVSSYTNYELILSNRFYLLPTENSVNAYLQIGAGLLYGKKKTVYQDPKITYVPYDFVRWSDNNSTTFGDAEYSRRVGKPDDSSGTRICPVFDISIGIELGNNLLIGVGTNISPSSSCGTVSAGLKF